jgi:hypothetical protein
MSIILYVLGLVTFLILVGIIVIIPPLAWAIVLIAFGTWAVVAGVRAVRRGK